MSKCHQVETRDGVEFTAEWVCPKCGHRQTETIHPELGPWVSVICVSCEAGLSDSELDADSLANLETARDRADAWER